ncbi:Short-chain dehydrogenase/reductase SDR [Penicillium expansum]|uniref:Short-chain dehydrogenase/reductase SDR n=1 Tax=Penicillium expansum TaxID=27334 RepID=A0A0A2J7T5_PENEN|nr:Short-chain dehydrogenase/reductase SDR [Penicillium expansum]KGO50718.1 Short-chain dehydrogenase/reductase SDR [Penicillium expansum]
MNTPRVVIVTGGADGFGAAIVDRFSREGCKVILIDLDQAKGESKQRADSNISFLPGDVTRPETWQNALDLAQTTYGRVDVVVNNAGITHNPSPIHTKSLLEYEKTFNVNVKPVFISAQVFAPVMIQQGHGIFINITSTGCTRPRPGFAIYNASKAAVEVATKTMALEYAPAIRFNCISPAVGNTTMLQASIGNGEDSHQRLRQVEESLPMKRLCQPVDIANAAWYLGSEQSSFVTGTTLEMRCIRPQREHHDDNSTEPCQRCKRTNRECNIPEPRKLGRKRGATGRYQGFEKAYRKMRSELKKAKTSHTDENDEMDNFVAREEPILELLFSNHPTETTDSAHALPELGTEGSSVLSYNPTVTTAQDDEPLANLVSPVFGSGELSQSNREPISNPLALLADASDAAQALELHSKSANPSPETNESSSATQSSASQPIGARLGRQLLHRPGYVSLGLQLGRDTLEAGIDTLVGPSEHPYRYSNYFKSSLQVPLRDVGPDVDPVDLGLVTMDEACYLFPVYFVRLHPVNGILDPTFHTPDFVRSRSALLFTWILALTAQFDHGSASLAKRLRLHGEKLSKHVHTSGYKSVEIVQGYYISLLSATPAETLAQERSWLYTMYALGVAAELGLDQDSHAKDSTPLNTINASYSRTQDATPTPLPGNDSSRLLLGYPSKDLTENQRMARNRERTWLRILLWERANSAARGRNHTFPETDLTQRVDSWWIHHLADPTDKHTCAFITLRRILASLQNELRHQAHLTHGDSHWVREMVDSSLRPWCDLWLSHPMPNLITSPSEKLSSIFLHYVYLHGRLWTLSFALHGSISGDQNMDAIRADCFEAAVNSCELAVRDLDNIGEPLYCMLAPTWAMISYAGVLALKLFPALYGSRIGNDVELLALLSQVAIQLERAGTTPSHRFGIAALLGQHLMMILRARAAGLKDLNQLSQARTDTYTNTGFDDGVRRFMPQQSPHSKPYETLISDYDPFLTTASMSTQGDLTGEGFADFIREMFGPGFGGVF